MGISKSLLMETSPFLFIYLYLYNFLKQIVMFYIATGLLLARAGVMLSVGEVLKAVIKYEWSAVRCPASLFG